MCQIFDQGEEVYVVEFFFGEGENIQIGHIVYPKCSVSQFCEDLR